MHDDYPIVIGLGGQAGVGKTSTAEGLVPGKVVRIDDNTNTAWDHMFLALPLYTLATIRRTIEGSERQLYQTMEVLLDLFVSPIYGGPPFENLVELTYEIIEMPIDMDMDEKPRDFLQQVGFKCREYNPHVFPKWIERSFNRRFNSYKDDHIYIVLVSDVRYPEEAEMIMNHTNGLLIKLEASDEVRNERLFTRDDQYMTEAQMSHESEQIISQLPSDIILDTNELSMQDQIIEVHSIISDKFNIRSTINAS